jgi:hypothetical protein
MDRQSDELLPTKGYNKGIRYREKSLIYMGNVLWLTMR